MSENIYVKATLKIDSNMNTNSEVAIIHLTKWERIVQALKILLLCWGIALLCVLIPGLHFILVPGGIILGIILFFKKIKLQEVLIQGPLICPECNLEFQAESTAFNWPKHEVCLHCGVEILLRKA